jgi:hypothetical protein
MLMYALYSSPSFTVPEHKCVLCASRTQTFLSSFLFSRRTIIESNYAIINLVSGLMLIAELSPRSLHGQRRYWMKLSLGIWIFT